MDLKTWDDIETFDDIIFEPDKDLIARLEKDLNIRCPHLKREGDYFYYCGINLPDNLSKELSHSNPIYQKHVRPVELQLYCMSEFEQCCYYAKRLKR